MSDFTVDQNGVIHGNTPGQFEFGERYVKCIICKVQRRPQEMKALGAPGNYVPVCKDNKVCDKLSE